MNTDTNNVGTKGDAIKVGTDVRLNAPAPALMGASHRVRL